MIQHLTCMVRCPQPSPNCEGCLWRKCPLCFGCVYKCVSVVFSGLRGPCTVSCQAQCIIMRGWPSGDEASSHPLLGLCLGPSRPTNDTHTNTHSWTWRIIHQWLSKEESALSLVCIEIHTYNWHLAAIGNRSNHRKKKKIQLREWMTCRLCHHWLSSL